MVKLDQLADIKTKLIALRVTTLVIEHGVKKLCNKEIRLVRVQWRDNPMESTEKTEVKMKASHPELFSSKFLLFKI